MKKHAGMMGDGEVVDSRLHYDIKTTLRTITRIAEATWSKRSYIPSDKRQITVETPQPGARDLHTRVICFLFSTHVEADRPTFPKHALYERNKILA